MDKEGVVHIYNVVHIYCSAVKKNEIMSLAAVWMSLEISILK